MSQASVRKICVLCGKDCSTRERIRDPKGRYYCKACYENARERLTDRFATYQATTAAGTPTAVPTPEPPDVDAAYQPPAAPAPPPGLFEPVLPPTNGSGTHRQAPHHPNGRSRAAADPLPLPLGVPEPVALEAPPVRPRPASPFIAFVACPQCGKPLPAPTVVCVQCGYNVQTRQQVDRDTGLPPTRPAPGRVALRHLAHPASMALAVGAAFGALLFLTRSNPATVVPVLGAVGALVVTTWILITVAAFRQRKREGVLCLALAPYAVYFVFGRSRRRHLQWLAAVTITIAVASAVMVQG